MATPPNRDTANTDALADLAALQAAANANFIDQAGQAIDNAVALGQIQVFLTTFENVDIETIHNYFLGLGYIVGFPDAFTLRGQPAELFGESLEEFWDRNSLPPMLTNPTRILLDWS